jgi:hypothetical protein
MLASLWDMGVTPQPDSQKRSLRARHRTKAEVFIVESGQPEDEADSLLEGEVLRQMLWLSGKTAQYRYIRTLPELRFVLDQFDASQSLGVFFDLIYVIDDFSFPRAVQSIVAWLMR